MSEKSEGPKEEKVEKTSAAAARPRLQASSPGDPRWAGRLAVVTGANSGIGVAIARQLLQLGMVVVAIDDRVFPLQELALKEPRLYSVVCDVSAEEDVLSTFRYVEETLGGVDVLVYNAGVTGFSSLLDGSPAEWRRLLDVNVVALCLCTREAVASMRRRHLADGQVVLVSSQAAHQVPGRAPLHFYSATKHAVKALADGFRLELADSGIRLTTVSPGEVKSTYPRSPLAPAREQQQQATTETTSTPTAPHVPAPAIRPHDVAQAVASAITAPKHVQVHDVVIKPTGSVL
ncbi:dehydrogenase/reductase SDR family member 11-like [Schistocerca piceifrons]|uniref:dehydrogenase/reductase SDR family member 11-like n=1 Tax=Schistocerca piceifrons TaxID=274613 RepID=UPI001F5EEFB6|nr:dehydrogenase/reductase SDR family member 11-like [Schistocerca piceifrons]XP_049944161.1 dehydrogenase/reductase SDR family member 11-like [Schistocerca serialis cubense]